MKIASSYNRGFELPGVDCSTFETISYRDLLLTKAKARSGQIRFEQVRDITRGSTRAGKTKHNPLSENKEAEDA